MALTEIVVMPGADYQAICDSVRGKTGGTALLKSGEVAPAIDEIATGVELPTLTNPGSAADLAEGLELIDGDGKVVTGTVRTVTESDVNAGEFSEAYFINNYVRISGTQYSDALVRGGAISRVFVPAEEFGDAATTDVVKGVTFTSQNGLKLTGEYEPPDGGGLPDGVTALATGTVLYESTTYGPYIEHGLGAVPNFYFVVAEGAASIAGFNGRMIAYLALKQTLESYSGYYATLSMSSGGSVTNNTQPISADNISDYFNETTIKPYAFFQTGKIYRWYAGVLDMIS